jgi:hypothetical protein
MVPHVGARETHQRLYKFSFTTPKRLLQQYRREADATRASTLAIIVGEAKTIAEALGHPYADERRLVGLRWPA